MMRLSCISAVALVCAQSAWAQDVEFSDEDLFVEANLIGIFYHELGHAMIDLLGLPVFGQEEDAADVASILLIDAFYEPEVAVDMAYDAAFGFAAEALLLEDEGLEVAWWDTHGPDEQRFYNTVCLFYGADPDEREDFALDMDLPEERADTCVEEFELAWDSWSIVLDELEEIDGAPLTFKSEGDSFTAELIGSEVAALNESFRWPEALEVRVEACDEPNAFYDPSGPMIIMCTEFDDHLRVLFSFDQ